MQEKTLLESVRAASLATHRGAGLATSIRSGGSDKAALRKFAEVTRLMRSAEALCRSAAALLVSQKAKGPGKASPGAKPGDGQAPHSNSSK
eukprot:2556512-Karenia_brevis.AAC.1